MKFQNFFKSVFVLFFMAFAVTNMFGQDADVIGSQIADKLSILLPIGFIVFVFLFLAWFFVSRFKRCPSDKILVIYGKTGQGSAKTIHGGAAFVWPVLQDYQYLDGKPMAIDVSLSDALSKQNIRVSVPSQFTVGIGKTADLMKAAAENLLGLSKEDIVSLAKDIIMGQMRLVIANMDIEELNVNRDKFVTEVYSHVDTELNKIGLKLINVNVTDIHDESDYIKALGQEAAAKAINEAKVKVSREEKTGQIGAATEQQEMRVKVAEANSMAEIGEKNAKAEATKGNNLADIQIAESASITRVRIADANKSAEIAEKTAQADAQTASFTAETKAENARKERELAARRANEVVQEEIEKEKTVIAAQAESEKVMTLAKGNADALLLNYTANAEGIQKMLDAQASGFEKIVASAGGDVKAAMGFLMLEKIENLAKIQIEGVKGIKFDKVVVFDGGGDGNGAAGFVNNLFKAVPPLNEFMQQSGLQLPEYLAKQNTQNPDTDTTSNSKK